VRLDRDDVILCAGTVMSTPFLDRLGPARAAGYAGVSMQPGDYHLLRAEGVTDDDIRAQVADHGLAISEFDAVTTWFAGQEPPASWDPVLAGMLRANTAEAVCPLAASVGARSVTVVEYYGVDVDADTAAAGFARVCDIAADHGLLAHIEFLPWAGVPNLHAAWEIVRRADRPNGGLLVDSWHLFRSGSTLEQLAAIPGEEVLYVQIDDAPAQPEPDLSEETQHRRLPPGEGSFDLIGFVRTLDQIGSTAPIGVEVFSDELAGLPVDQVVRRCADATRTVLRAARG
jgi:sugar phosphate isomerase/epimerase